MKSDPNRRFFSPYRLKIWGMTLKFCPVWPWNLSNHRTLKNNRVSLLWYFKLCASFQNHWWIQTGVTVQKRSIRVKIDDVYVLCDLEISRMTLNRARLLWHFVHNFIAICEVKTGVSVQKSPNLGKKIFELFDLAFWPLTLTFCMDITFVNDNYFWKFHDDTMTQTAKKLWRTSLSMNKPTTWCKSGRVSLVSSSCLYKTQPQRALAQVCHTRIDALSPDEYQSHLLLHRNSHHSQATYPKWLNH